MIISAQTRTEVDADSCFGLVGPRQDVAKAGVALWPFFCYVASYVVPQICHDIYATGVLEVALVGHK